VIPLHLHKGIKMSTMIKSKRSAVIKGELRMMGKKVTQEQDHHIQGCAIMFKEIISWITYLMILRKG
jgi:hypothetical protein